VAAQPGLSARELYEDIYCARGEMGTASRNASSICMPTAPRPPPCVPISYGCGFAAMAYVLVCALRRIGLAETAFANATCGIIRLKLLKIGALVRISVRRIRIAMASACPAAEDWARAAYLSLTPPRLVPHPPDTRCRSDPIAVSSQGPRRSAKTDRESRLRRHHSARLRDYRSRHRLGSL
jgi:hypothetical protein